MPEYNERDWVSRAAYERGKRDAARDARIARDAMYKLPLTPFPKCTTALALRPEQYLNNPPRRNTYLSPLQEDMETLKPINENKVCGRDSLGDNPIIENESKGEQE